MSFVEPDDIKSLIEGMLQHCWPTFRGPLQIPFPVMTYAQAIEEYGSDKPDTRFDMKVFIFQINPSQIQPSLDYLRLG